MNDPLEMLYALTQAIYIRDNAHLMSRELLIDNIEKLASYKVFSNRQIANICQNRIRYNVLGRYVTKKTKNGGKFNPESLDDIKELLFHRAANTNDMVLVKKVLDGGTSQVMLSKLTGLTQSTISRGIKNG